MDDDELKICGCFCYALLKSANDVIVGRFTG